MYVLYISYSESNRKLQSIIIGKNCTLYEYKQKKPLKPSWSHYYAYECSKMRLTLVHDDSHEFSTFQFSTQRGPLLNLTQNLWVDF